MHPFGQDFKIEFYPMIDDEPVIPSTDSPTIYVYADSAKPTRAEAAAGSGSPLQTITSWSDINDGKLISVSAITDPDTDLDKAVYTYWLAVNFTLKAGGDTQTIIRALKMERASAQLYSISIKDHDITRRWSKAKDFSTEVERAGYINNAVDEIKAELRAKGFEWVKLNRADALNSAAIDKCCANIALTLIQESGDRFEVSMNEFKEAYEKKINSLRLEYDVTIDGEADATANPIRSSIIIR